MEEFKNVKPGQLINNKAALNRKLKEIKSKFDWIETLVLTNSGSDEGLPDDQVDHDFNREMHFYRQAQSSVLEGLKRLHSLNVPTRRPEDYFAEMAKSDAHMLKVKKALAEREAVLNKIERAKKMRQEKKMAKMVQNQVKIAKQQEKKELMQKVARYQKGKEKSLDFLNDKPAAKKEKEAKPVKKMSKKALHKKKVYGFGGQKKRSKYNTAESAADVSGFKKGRPKGAQKGAKGAKSPSASSGFKGTGPKGSKKAGGPRGTGGSRGAGGSRGSGGSRGPKATGGFKGSRGGKGGGDAKGPRSKPQARRGSGRKR